MNDNSRYVPLAYAGFCNPLITRLRSSELKIDKTPELDGCSNMRGSRHFRKI